MLALEFRLDESLLVVFGNSVESFFNLAHFQFDVGIRLLRKAPHVSHRNRLSVMYLVPYELLKFLFLFLLEIAINFLQGLVLELNTVSS